MRFRAVAPAGSAITLVMRLRAGNGGCRLRIRSGSGSETEVSLSDSVDGVAVLACVVETDDLVTATLSLQGARPGGVAGGASYWALKGILYVWSGLQIDANGSGSADRPRSSAESSTLQAAVDRPHPDGPLQGPARIDVAPVLMDATRARASIDAFVSSTDCYWSSIFPGYKGAPILADQTDKQMFYNAKDAVVGPTSDKMTLFRRSNQWVSMTRFSEGTIFDAMGVSRGIGYLQGAPDHSWLSRNNWGAAWISKEAFSAAPYYDKSYLIFYNGNLHNYYHWVIEGLLPLYVLSQAFGPSFNVHLALPRSRHINAVFDHRASLDAVGLGGYDITEIPEDLVKVREAIWVESDLIENMPAPFLRDFQRAVAAIHTRSRRRKKRRLLVLRKGPTRTIVNIKRVRSFLSSHGFESIYLEGMSVTDQIVLFQNAEFIVSPHGAGLSNLVFCEPGTKVIEFMPMVEMRPFFWLISEKLGLVHGMLFSTSAEAADMQAPMTIDIDRLEALYRMVNAHR
jgi:hypothetical protein